ncbi:MAG TPA: cytochrome c biogenesis protein CcdA [Actinomycetota bacterium]|nr:cytochrome c biogenesis protein CcdA [Actinomycetota bacterium]
MSETAAPASTRPESRRRIWGAATTVLVLGVSVTAGLLSSPDGGAPVIFVERISSAIGGLTSAEGSSVWWVYAFFLGIVAAFNPCGFALLPAYLGLYLNEKTEMGLATRTRRSLAVSAVVAVAFTLLFGVTGALFSLASSLVIRLLPWVGLGVGVLLIIAGGVSIGGKTLGLRTAQQAATRIGRDAGSAGTRGYAAFGLAYGLASLGCALPLFLALLGTAVAVGGPWSAVVAFALYGVGMATTLGVLTLVAGIVNFGVLVRVRALGRFVSEVGSVLLLVSGAYVVYYWLTAGRYLFA